MNFEREDLLAIEQALHLAMRDVDGLLSRARIRKPADVPALQRQRERFLTILDRIIEEVDA